MSDPFFAALDIGLVFALALGLALWQLVALKRGLRRDREAAARSSADEDGSRPHRIPPVPDA
ncbi:hypothetical protein [Methylobacterium sp. J-090]|uniref:hypothetical protein n=1 Tax=Methylobacterium sp. J-090 TaxID=2836666 RepID=UPI001FB975F0|nr:hypothetical protein [Methylobacterium sp. J-090]MCJ2081588.1 hypothetical protein [Methylobacterium sp. J-090]